MAALRSALPCHFTILAISMLEGVFEVAGLTHKNQGAEVKLEAWSGIGAV